MDQEQYRRDEHGQRVARRKFPCRVCGKTLRLDRPKEHEACTANLLGGPAGGWLRKRFPMVGPKGR